MVKLFDNDNEAEIGKITESQLDFLQEQLLEECIDATTYDVSQASIESLATNGADDDLIDMLRKAIGTRGSMEVRFELD